LVPNGENPMCSSQKVAEDTKPYKKLLGTSVFNKKILFGGFIYFCFNFCLRNAHVLEIKKNSGIWVLFIHSHELEILLSVISE